MEFRSHLCHLYRLLTGSPFTKARDIPYDLRLLYHNLLRHRYTLRVSSLNCAYHEADHLLLHASFQVLADFVEQGRPWAWCDERDNGWQQLEQTDPGQYRAYQELRGLYFWWKEVYPHRQDPYDLMPDAFPDYDWKQEFARDDNGSLVWRPSQAYEERVRPILEQMEAMERAYAEEDQRNLERLTGLRRYLCT